MLWALAREQHYVVTREQLHRLGYDDNAIKHRVRRGRLHPLFRGVYAVGRRDVTRTGLFVAAVLACGDGAALSHEHAGEQHGIRPRALGDIEVSVPGDRRGQRGIRAHRRQSFQATRACGVPVTTVVQTLIDLAPRLSRDEQEAMVGEADQRRLIDPERLRRALDRAPRQPGVGILKATLDRRTFVLTHTQLERLFVPLAVEAGAGRPTGQRQLGPHRVDFYFEHLDLVVECDSLRYHRTAAQQSRDSRRDNEHVLRGRNHLRFSHYDVRYDPRYVVETLQAFVVASGPACRGSRRDGAGRNGRSARS